MTATVRTENYRGPLEKGITVTTTDPTKPNVQLRVRLRIVGSVEFVPRPGLAFPSGVSWDYSGKLIIRKDETETGELNITGLTTTAPWLVAKVRKAETQEPAAEGIPAANVGDWILEVSVTEDAPRGQSGQQVKFKSGLPREPEVTLPVSVVLQNPMRVTPSPLLLPEPAAGKEASGVLTAKLRPGLGKETLKAQASPDPFTVKVEPAGPRQYKAVVSWKPTAEVGGAKEGSIIFRLGDESLTVPVSVGDPKAGFRRAPLVPPALPANP